MTRLARIRHVIDCAGGPFSLSLLLGVLTLMLLVALGF